MGSQTMIESDFTVRLGILESKLDALTQMYVKNQDERLQRQRDFDERLFGPYGLFVKYGERVRRLENWQSKMHGALWAIGVIWTAITAVFAWLFLRQT